MQLIAFHSLAHTSSKVFTTLDSTISSMVPSSHPSPPIRSLNPDESNFIETSSMSHQVDLQYIIPDLSLGLNECQRIFASRLRKLVRIFTHCSRTIMGHFLQLDSATSKGLHVPHDLILSSLPLISQTELASIAESCHNLMSVRFSTIVGPWIVTLTPCVKLLTPLSSSLVAVELGSFSS